MTYKYYDLADINDRIDLLGAADSASAQGF